MKKLLRQLRPICLALPEAIETVTFGNPTWQAGAKRTFCVLEEYDGELSICVKATPADQVQLLLHPKFYETPYTGKHGWVSLRTSGKVDWDQVAELVEASYRLVALKRMVKALDHRRLPRCTWPGDDEQMLAYHDEEWGVPLHDDRALFEAIILDGAQAGLSWRTILHRREGYRKAYRGFDPARVAKFGARDEKRLLADPGIIRNRLKVAASIGNARAFLAVQEEFGSFDAYYWDFVGGRPVVNRWKRTSQLPARTKLSDEVSADLKRRGFKFVGSTIVYAMLQATGVVNDHLVGCYRYAELTK